MTTSFLLFQPINLESHNPPHLALLALKDHVHHHDFQVQTDDAQASLSLHPYSGGYAVVEADVDVSEDFDSLNLILSNKFLFLNSLIDF